MAHFEISADEYRKWNHVGRKRTWKAYLAWAIALIALIVSWMLKQYAFTLLWAAFLIFIYLSIVRMMPKMEAKQMNSPFAFGPFDLVLGPDSYVARVGGSELRLNLRELAYVHDFGDHYRLDHQSGSIIYLPKRALSQEEVQLVESYRKQFPGIPDKKPWQMLSEDRGITRA